MCLFWYHVTGYTVEILHEYSNKAMNIWLTNNIIMWLLQTDGSKLMNFTTDIRYILYWAIA